MVFSGLCENELGCQELEHTALQQYLQAPPGAQGFPGLLQTASSLAEGNLHHITVPPSASSLWPC